MVGSIFDKQVACGYLWMDGLFSGLGIGGMDADRELWSMSLCPVGGVYHGEEKAPGRAHQGLPVPKGGLKKGGRGTFQTSRL